jgi:recombinational DNA repair protein (RecF pathway)
MQKGIIFYTKPFSEKDLLIKLVNQDGEIVSGFVKYGLSSKNNSIYQISNLISYERVGREDALGSIKGSCLKSFSSIVSTNRIANFACISLCGVLNCFFRNANKCDIDGIFDKIVNFLQLCCISNDHDVLISGYLDLEKEVIFNNGTIDEEDNCGNNYIYLQNIFSSYSINMPVCREMLETLILKAFT